MAAVRDPRESRRSLSYGWSQLKDDKKKISYTIRIIHMPKEWKKAMKEEAAKPKPKEESPASLRESDLFAAEMGHEVSSLDLHGMRSDEAESEIESFLNHAFAQGEKAVCIVHGKGTGTLRQLLHKHLLGHPLVERFRDSNVRLGGATVIALHSKDTK